MRADLTLEMRPVAPDEFEQWLRAESRAFGNRLDDDPEALRPHFDLDRSIAVFDRGEIVGGAHSHRIEMSVPGASAVAAGVANVAVQPTHRRRGMMTRMMDHQMKDIHERGEPLAALFAAESIIYGRLGYGIGSFHERWTIERHHNAFAQPFDRRGRISFVEPGDITKELPDVFRRGTTDRPGVVPRALHLWDRAAQDPEHSRGGAGGLFYAVYEQDGGADGYVTYRTRGGTLIVNELMAVTKEASAALWRFCFDVDLMRSTEAHARPVDDPLPWMLADPRRLQRSTSDAMWLRLVDVRAALALRRYMQSDRVVLEVRDDPCPWNDGRFELEGSPDGTACRVTRSSPDLVLAAADLAAAYLGTVRFTTLWGAGLVDERTPGALRRADAMFASQLQPWTPHGF